MRNRNTRLSAALALGACALLAPSSSSQATVDFDQKLFLPGGAALESFGRAIEVGPGEALVSGNAIDQGGAVIAFSRVGSQWVFQQEFTSSDITNGDFFGFDIALDGTRLAVGANQQEPVGKLQTGAVYIFEKVGGVWTETQKVVAPDPVDFDYFGRSVDLAGDLLVVGCSANAEAAGAYSGAVYVYRDIGGTWTFEQKLFASNPDLEDQFGWEVLTDGTMIVTSAIEDTEGAVSEAGTVYQFDWNGSTWTETQRFVDATPASGARFGWDMDLEGNTLLVGAPQHPGGGRVAVFDNSGGSWVFQEAVVPSKNGNHSFGWSVDLSFDRFVAGAPGADGLAGAVYPFHHDGSRWVEVEQVLSDDAAAGFPAPQMGMACGLYFKHGFGGAPFGNSPAASSAGVTYAFDLDDIGLEAVPAQLTVPGDMVLESHGGLALDDMGLFLVDISGVPINAWLLFDAFDADGKQTTTIPMPASAAGLDLSVISLGFWQPGRVGFSDLVTVEFL